MNTNIDQANRDNTTELCKISTGKYSRVGKSGNYLVKGQIRILVATRDNTNTTKPPQFLVLKKPVKRWISSLYSTITPGIYNFDDFSNGIKYKLKLLKTEAIITLR